MLLPPPWVVATLNLLKIGVYMKTLQVLLFAAFCALPAVVKAQPEIPGQDNAEFNRSMDLWLEGDDLLALRSFSELAQSGNSAAQVFLARIAVHGHLHKHVTMDLPRAERVALLRQQGGLSGKSWLSAAQADVPLAAAFLQANRPGDKPAAIRALFAYGEVSEGLRNLPGVIITGQAKEALEILTEVKSLPPEAGVIAQMALGEMNAAQSVYGSARMPLDWRLPRDGGAVRARDRMSWYPVSPRALSERRDLLQAALIHAKSVPAWQPLLKICSQSCASTLDRCMALGGSLLVLAPFHPFASPSQAILQQERYWDSPRITMDVARRLPNLQEFGPWVREFDACFTDTFTDLQNSYGRY